MTGAYSLNAKWRNDLRQRFPLGALLAEAASDLHFRGP